MKNVKVYFFFIKGIHRNLGVHCSRARSLLMDEKIWNPTLVEASLLSYRDPSG